MQAATYTRIIEARMNRIESILFGDRMNRINRIHLVFRIDIKNEDK
jgi:hypothetical protein